VFNELAHADSPPLVRAFATHKPPWLDVHPDPSLDISELTDASLDEGERAAIALAKSIAADLILMDDRAGASSGSVIRLRSWMSCWRDVEKMKHDVRPSDTGHATGGRLTYLLRRDETTRAPRHSIASLPLRRELR
jgi:hypothetical protein